MSFRFSVGACLLMTVAISATSWGQQEKASPKTKVELRWVESKPTEGLTEVEGFQTSCDPDSKMYPHLKAALQITSAEVTEVKVKRHDFTKSGSGVQHMVAFHLTQDARDKLAATCEGKETKYLTAMIDGKPWGLFRYEKDKEKPFVPEQCRAATFLPEVGFFASSFQAERVASAAK